MGMRITVLLLAAALLVSGCATPPQGGSIVIASVFHVFTEEQFKSVSAGESPSNVYEKNVIFPMVMAGIKSGLTLENVRQGQFVICQCKCGAECYARYPVLLPKHISAEKYDVVELEAGNTEWHSNTKILTYKLSHFRRLFDIPWERRPRSRTCDPAKWPI